MSRLTLVFLLAASGLVFGQSPTPAPAPKPPAKAPPAVKPFFRSELPGGTYSVALEHVVSVSSHEYVVDAAARVTEVNIDTVGNVLVRFYVLEPNKPTLPSGLGAAGVQKAEELLKQGADKTGQDDAWKKVVKSYPASTHAHTVEYRLEKREDLEKIFNTADEAFRTQQSRMVKIE